MLPQRRTAASSPAGVPYAPTAAAPTWKTCRASPNETSIGTSGSRGPALGGAAKEVRRGGSAPPPGRRAGRRAKEARQRRLSPRAGDEQLAAGARAGQQRLGDPGRETCRDRRVD